MPQISSTPDTAEKLLAKLDQHIQVGQPEFTPNDKVLMFDCICGDSYRGLPRALPALTKLLDHFGFEDIQNCFREGLPHRLVRTVCDLSDSDYYHCDEPGCSQEQSIYVCSQVLSTLVQHGSDLEYTKPGCGYANLFHMACDNACDDEGTRLNPIAVLSLVGAGVDVQKNSSGIWIPHMVQDILRNHPISRAAQLNKISQASRPEGSSPPRVSSKM